MGQQPNLQLIEVPPDQPGDEPGPPRSWSPTRPGEIHGPEEVPSGGPFGTTGPDAGYAYCLIEGRDLQFPETEARADVVAVLGALTMARAARFGRGPSLGDVEVAELVLGYDTTSSPASVVRQIAEERGGWIAGAAHHPDRARRIVAAADEVLTDDADDLRARLVDGDRVIDL